MAARGGFGRTACAVSALVTLGLGACSPAPPAGGPLVAEPPCAELRWDGAARRPDLILVVNDTMRRDRVGLYGGPAATPALDALGREHLAFERAYSAAPWTKPSIASLFTGLHPSQHGVLNPPGADAGNEGLATEALPEELTTLAEMVRAGGYETAAFVGNPWLRAEFGFAQGFDHYDDSFAANDVVGQVVVDAALAWLRARPAESDRPYFLYLHTMDSHGPYPPLPLDEALRVGAEAAAESPLPPRALAEIRRTLRLPDGRPLAAEGVPPSRALLLRAYDRGIEQFDRALGRLLRGVDQAAEKPAVVVTSDHGESLFERGWAGHGHALFEPDVGVPLVARLPGVSAPGPVTCPVAAIDLLATFSRYLALPDPPHDFGVSFLGPAEDAPRWIVSEGVLAKPTHRALRNRGWALLHEPEGRLVRGPVPEPAAAYELSRDPGEAVNRVGAAVDGAQVREAAAAAVPDFDAPTAGRVPVDEATRLRLEALGYMEAP